MVKNFLRHPCSCTSVWEEPDEVVEACLSCWRELVMLATKRLSVGRAWGTMSSWHDFVGVARMVAKMWMMHACRSVLIIEGKTSAASTRASKAVPIRRIASSVIWYLGCC